MKDCRRNRVHAVKGDNVEIPVLHTRSSNAASIIASLSIEGIQSVTTVDVNEEGNIDGERFLQAFSTIFYQVVRHFLAKGRLL